jgi:hypothetical protein
MAEVKHLDWRTLIAIKEAPEGTAEALDKYFEPFAQPPGKPDEYDGRFTIDDGQPCLKCDKPLVGLSSFVFGGGFTWGLAHGEGFCAHCKWPARAYHFIKKLDGSELATLRNVILQYHPDYVETRKKTKAA